MAHETIEQIWAFVSIDKNDPLKEEGVMAFSPDAGRTMLPLIASDRVRIDQYIPIANQIAAWAGMQYKIVEFSQRRVVTDQFPGVVQP